MKKLVGVVAAGLMLAAPMARAAVTFEYLFDNAFGLAISADGTVVAGNTVGAYSAFRWTQATGVVDLERSAAEMVGISAGTPGLSADGTRVASSIGSEDSAYVTAGLWTLGEGWNQIAPPVPPGGGVVDQSLCSVWGLSGDGRTVVGLLCRPGSRDHAFSWRQDTGMIDLGSSGRSSRANGASYNGSVVAGWDEHLTFGYRQAAAWRDGALMKLGLVDDISEAACVSRTGEWIGGFSKNDVAKPREASLWQWTGAGWSQTKVLGSVPGTSPNGIAKVTAVSADGKMAIGYNSFDGDPFETTGFIWTDSTGCMDILFWLAEQGIEVDPNFDIKSLEAMTPDGKTLIGFGQRADGPPYTYRTFRIQLDRAALAVDPHARIAHDQKIAAAPNPVRSQTAITFTLPTGARAELAILDVSGRVVRRLADASLAAGPHSFTWDRRDDSGSRAGAGIYFAKLQAGTARVAAKLIVVD
jgi:uncharacterized membrane protein